MKIFLAAKGASASKSQNERHDYYGYFLNFLIFLGFTKMNLILGTISSRQTDLKGLTRVLSLKGFDRKNLSKPLHVVS